MDETPKIPEEFDNKEELELYISKLHDYVELLEEELEESKKDDRKLKQELSELAENVSKNKNGDLNEIHTKLEEFMSDIDDIELHGIPETDSLNETLRNPDF